MSQDITVKQKTKSTTGYVLGVKFENGQALNPTPAARAFFESNPSEYDVNDGRPKAKQAGNGGS